MADLTATQKAINLAIQLGMDTPNDLLTQTGAAATAAAGLTTVTKITKNLSDQAVSLSTLFPGLSKLKVLAFKEITAVPVGCKFKLTSASNNKLTLRAGGTFLAELDETALPTLYFDNASLTTDVELLIVAVGS